MIAKNISAMEARKRFGEIMNLVALRGESFTIERAGKPLVRIVPVNQVNEGVFEHPFAKFTEWNHKSDDAYDTLENGYKAMARDSKYNTEATDWIEGTLDTVE